MFCLVPDIVIAMSSQTRVSKGTTVRTCRLYLQGPPQKQDNHKAATPRRFEQLLTWWHFTYPLCFASALDESGSHRYILLCTLLDRTRSPSQRTQSTYAQCTCQASYTYCYCYLLTSWLLLRSRSRLHLLLTPDKHETPSVKLKSVKGHA